MTKTPDKCTLEVRVVPKSSKDAVVGIQDGRLKIKVSAPPVDGRSNKRLVEFVAKSLGIAKTRVEIIKGHKSKLKTLVIHGFEGDPCKKLLESV